MKKGLLFFIVITLFSFTGCSAGYFSKWFHSEQKEADRICQQIIDAYEQQDSEKLKELFSEEGKENIVGLDEKIASFLAYIHGNIISFEGDCASSSESDYGKKKTELNGMYLIITDEERYCMNFYMYSEDDENPQNIGLYKIEIATEKEVNSEKFVWDNPEMGVFMGGEKIQKSMYTDFLTGVSSLDKEELDFKNIQEDTSQVNWEEGTGKRTVTFEWKDKQFTLEAVVVDDWFDENVANELNKIIKEYGNEKQLFFASDGYQEGIVFYRDKKWADAFQMETGLELVEYN